MSRLAPLQLMIANIKNEIEPGRREYRTRAEAMALLKRLTGQDFGEDIGRWEKWVKQNPRPVKEKTKQGFNRFGLKENGK